MKLVFASKQKNKIKEIQQLLPSSIEIVSLKISVVMRRFQKTVDT
jgi:XTP/dITP diphosphohydrolase